MKRRSHAFTLVEILIALSIMGFILAAISSMYIYSIRTSNTTTVNLQLSQKLRSFTSTILNDVEAADGLAVYTSFQGTRTLVASGGKGNYLVLYYTDYNQRIYKIVGYYLLDNATDANPLAFKRHETVFSSTYTDLSQVPLPAANTTSTHTTVLDKVSGQHLQGTATSVFLYQDATKVLVSGKSIAPALGRTPLIMRPFSFILSLWSTL